MPTPSQNQKIVYLWNINFRKYNEANAKSDLHIVNRTETSFGTQDALCDCEGVRWEPFSELTHFKRNDPDALVCGISDVFPESSDRSSSGQNANSGTLQTCQGAKARAW